MLDTLFPSITGLRFDKNIVTEVPFEFHVMTQLTELRFDEHLMRSPAMEIWVRQQKRGKKKAAQVACFAGATVQILTQKALQELGIGRTMEFMRKFFEYRCLVAYFTLVAYADVC
jgi:hypothetical protein